MKQERNLFEYEFHLEKLNTLGDPLLKLRDVIPWDVLFRKPLKRIILQGDASKGGRPPYDPVLMFKILILQKNYGLSDEQTEFQINDRLSFQRFLGFTLSDTVPDARTIWLFRDKLTKANLVRRLFKKFEDYLEKEGYLARQGVIVDASFVEVPRQRNSKAENAEIKAGKIPVNWSDKKKSHKDTEAKWTKKNQQSFYGYKNHIKIDAKSKLILNYGVTDASVHDSQALMGLLEKTDRGQPLHADSAYRSKAIEARLRRKKIESRIHEKGRRGKSLTKKQIASNTLKSRTRARVEHIFGCMKQSHGDFIRTIGLSRAHVQIGLTNLVYNLKRFVFLNQ